MELWRGHRGLLGVVAITTLGAWLRLRSLGELAIHPDEGIYLMTTAPSSFSEMLSRALPHTHPLLHFVLLWVAQRFGAGYPAILSLSLLFGILVVPAFYFLARQLFGVTAALVTALLVAVSPGCIELSQTIRPYMLNVLLLAGSLAFFARFVTMKSTRAARGSAAGFGLALSTHYATFTFLPTVIASLLPMDRDAELPLRVRHDATILFKVVLWIALLWTVQIATWVGAPIAGNLMEVVPFPSSPFDLLQAWNAVARFLVGPTAAPFVLPALLVSWAIQLRERRYLLLALCALPILVNCALALLHLYPLVGSRHSVHLAISVFLSLGALVELLVTHRRNALSATSACFAGVALTGAFVAGVHLEPNRFFPGDRTEHPFKAIEVQQFIDALNERSHRSGILALDRETLYLLQPYYGNRLAPPQTQGGAEDYRVGALDMVGLGTWQWGLKGRRLMDDVSLVREMIGPAHADRPLVIGMLSEEAWGVLPNISRECGDLGDRCRVLLSMPQALLLEMPGELR